MSTCPGCTGDPADHPSDQMAVTFDQPAPDRPGDRDQQQAADPWDAAQRLISQDVRPSYLREALVMRIAAAIAAARAEEAARWRAKIEALATEIALHPRVRSVDVAARLRALLDKP